MIEWITANLATILVTAALVLVVGLIIYKMVKDKKAGRSSCSCGCSCESCGVCSKDNSGK